MTFLPRSIHLFPLHCNLREDGSSAAAQVKVLHPALAGRFKVANVSEALTITELARRTGASAKTLRYWERLGLLPRAARTHSGYRVFDHQALHYAEFIRKSKSVGLTLREMQRVLKMAGAGRNPCPEVVRWIDGKAREVEQQIRSLQALQRRLREFRRIYHRGSPLECSRPGELCCLIENLPDFKPEKGGRNAKGVRASADAADSDRRQSRNGRRGSRC
ncbi:MAG: MerR family DNA-binding transcriptional regulator [Terriglobales bacterium]